MYQIFSNCVYSIKQDLKNISKFWKNHATTVTNSTTTKYSNWTFTCRLRLYKVVPWTVKMSSRQPKVPINIVYVYMYYVHVYFAMVRLDVIGNKVCLRFPSEVFGMEPRKLVS